MEQQELLSDSSDSIESPQSMNASSSDSLKLPRQRNIWQDWPWILITVAAYFSFWFISYPTQIPDTPQIPKLNEIVIISSAITVGLGGIWFYFMLRYAKILLIISIAVLPLILSVLIGVVFTIPNPVVDASIVVALLIMMAAGFIGIILSKRQSLSITIQLLEFSCDIIRNNPMIWVIAIGIMTIHGIFSIAWISLFGAIFGDLKNHGISPVMYYVFIYFLSSSILANIEKVFISGVVGDWYFDRKDKSVIKHLKYALSYSFGSVCFASFIQGLLGTMKFSLRILSRITANRFECITCILAAGLSILEEWTPFALTKVGISGDDLWTSAKKCTLLFRRNLILGLLSSSLSRILVFSSILGICCCSGIAVGYISSFSMHNYLSVAMGGIAAIIPFYMLRLAGQIITHTMDCTFICYLLDMDSNTCHCSVAHRLFAQT